MKDKEDGLVKQKEKQKTVCQEQQLVWDFTHSFIDAGKSMNLKGETKEVYYSYVEPNT